MDQCSNGWWNEDINSSKDFYLWKFKVKDVRRISIEKVTWAQLNTTKHRNANQSKPEQRKSHDSRSHKILSMNNGFQVLPHLGKTPILGLQLSLSSSKHMTSHNFAILSMLQKQMVPKNQTNKRTNKGSAYRHPDTFMNDIKSCKFLSTKQECLLFKF